MTGRIIACLLAAAALAACEGTSTGNPYGGEVDSSGGVPGFPVPPPPPPDARPPDAEPPPPDVTPPAAFALVQSDEPRREPDATAEEVGALAGGNRAFAFALYTELAGTPGNLFFSPYALGSALATVYAGARGDTAAEMRAALRVGLPDERLHAAFNTVDRALANRAVPPVGYTGDGFTLENASSIWLAQGAAPLPPFLDTLARYYGEGVRLVDFSTSPETARSAINGWTTEKLGGRGAELLLPGSVGPDTRLVVTDAASFRASFGFGRFSEASTADGAFHASAGDVPARFMNAGLDAGYGDLPGYDAARIPLLGGVDLLILVPDAGTFAAFEGRLDDAVLSEALGGLSAHSLRLGLPRFSAASAVDLREPLSRLGMPSAFDPARADFSGVAGARDLVLGPARHGASVAVTETGVDAVAASTGVVSPPTVPPPATLFVDRPFVFVVYDAETEHVVFLGRVATPQ